MVAFLHELDSTEFCWLGIRLLARFADHGIMLVKYLQFEQDHMPGRFFEGLPQQEASAESDDAEPGCSAADEPYAESGSMGDDEAIDYRSEISDHNITGDNRGSPNNTDSLRVRGHKPLCPLPPHE